MADLSAELIERWKEKGGTIHGSLARGCVLSINGDKPRVLVKPMPELLPLKKKPDVIYL